jgi:Flp pilus assembly protein TadG
MKRTLSSAPRAVRRLLRDRSGATALLFGFMAVGLMGTAGLTVDVGQVFVSKRAFDAATQSAALAGANALLANNANLTTVTAAVTAWNTANPPSKISIGHTSVAISCNTTTANLPTCNGTSSNVATVTQTASVTTHFLRAFGFPTISLASTASAAKAGGSAIPLNVMFVLDATQSMNDADSGCTGVPGIAHPTRFQCAMYSIQSVLKKMPTSMDKAGLMIFPGMATQYSPTSHPCATQPNSTPYYSANIKYQIGTTLDVTYNNGAGALVNTSPLVQAVGNYSATPSVTGCVTAKGGQGSYAAEVLTKAKAALPVVAGTQNVIIFLSDGDFNASASQLSNTSGKSTKQCDQAIAAAQAATTAGYTVYAVAYGAATSGCSSGDTHNPCTTMQTIASDKTRFYTTSTGCQMTGSPNAVANLPAAFQSITTTLTKPRLVH